MEQLKQETELKLSKTQLQSIINNHIQQEEGLNELFTMMVNGLMLSERSTFLDQNNKEQNKGNGYRYASRSGIGSKLQLIWNQLPMLINFSTSLKVKPKIVNRNNF